MSWMTRNSSPAESLVLEHQEHWSGDFVEIDEHADVFAVVVYAVEGLAGGLGTWP